MKKLFAIVAMLGMFTFGTQMVYAQEEVAPVATEVSDSIATDSTAVAEEVAAEEAPAVVEEAESEGFHKILKTKFIEGDAAFMSLVAIAMVIGLAFCIEIGCAEDPGSLRILYWNIQNGMWSDQGDNYDNFVDFVVSEDPDICIWAEAESRYRTDTAEKMAGCEEAYLPYNWMAR